MRGSLEWTRVKANGPGAAVFWDWPAVIVKDTMQSGGWRLIIAWGKYVTALFAYDGRRRPGRETVHLGRMEVRAVF